MNLFLDMVIYRIKYQIKHHEQIQPYFWRVNDIVFLLSNPKLQMFIL